MINIITNPSKRSGFTMIELIFAIIVMGIIASMAIPRMDRDIRTEARDNIVSSLQYTQILALADNKTNPDDDDWQQTLWQMRTHTGNGEWFYTIYSDRDKDGIQADKNDCAIDSSNGKFYYNNTASNTIEADESENIFLEKKYGVDNIAYTGGCVNSNHIAFDHMGRPHVDIDNAANDYRSYMLNECNITVGFTSSGIDDLIITIQPETGHISTN